MGDRMKAYRIEGMWKMEIFADGKSRVRENTRAPGPITEPSFDLDKHEIIRRVYYFFIVIIIIFGLTFNIFKMACTDHSTR